MAHTVPDRTGLKEMPSALGMRAMQQMLCLCCHVFHKQAGRLYKPVVRMWQVMALRLLLLLQCCLGQSVRQDQIRQPAADECCQVVAPKATAWELASGLGG